MFTPERLALLCVLVLRRRRGALWGALGLNGAALLYCGVGGVAAPWVLGFALLCLVGVVSAVNDAMRRMRRAEFGHTAAERRELLWQHYGKS